MLVHETLERCADVFPEKVALVSKGRRYSYAELESQANRLANALREHGVMRGDRVALLLPNQFEFAVGIYAVLKAGGVFVPINQSTKADKCAYILSNCNARALISGGRPAKTARDVVGELPSVHKLFLVSPGDVELRADEFSYEAVQNDYPDERPPRVNIDLDLASLIYTSGSTGEPKGVMSDHSNVTFAAGSIIEYVGNVPGDVVINVLPMSFDYGLYQLLMTVQFGGTLVLEQGFNYPAKVLEHIQRERVTGFPGVPTIFSVLLQMDLSLYDLSSLRYLTNTAAVLPPAHIKRLQKLLPRTRLISMYGLTETKRTLYLPPEHLDAKPSSVGIAIPGTEVWIEGPQGERLPPCEVGELVVRGRHVMRGYWNDPGATEKRFRPGPLPGERVCHTGDLFRMDEDGCMYFVSRLDDVIKSRGEKVAPKEIENVLYALPGVREAAVIGVPDPVLGQAIKAFVVTDGTTDVGAILRHCRENLEDLMVPRQVVLCPDLPKTASGKIRKTDLN